MTIQHCIGAACEIWGAEYQENDVILVQADDVKIIEAICVRERCPMCVVGEARRSNQRTSLMSVMCLPIPSPLSPWQCSQVYENVRVRSDSLFSCC